MIKPHINFFTAVLLVFVAGLPISAMAQFISGGPKPGDVYKEYVLTLKQGKKTWRVTDPNASHPGSPGNSPSDYLPNEVHSFNIDDYANVERAEIVIDVWGGHVGTTGKKIKFNNNSWITIPELNTTPGSGQCYAQQLNYTISIPVSHLKTGNNTIQGTSGGQTCYNFNWGQWGWYGAAIRVYYSTNKGHTTGQITSPSTGSTISDNPTIQINPGGNVSKIDVLAKYEGYDTDGDGYFYEWGGDYHRTSWSDDISLNNHVGTITSSPYQITWDTEWVPDQNPGAVSILAIIQNSNGYKYVTNEAKNLTLQRNNHSVRLYKPQNVPERFWVRAGQVRSSKVNIPTLSNATEANVFVRTWNGRERHASYYTKVNGYNLPSYGLDHFYSLDMLNVPVSALNSGNNTITFQSSTTHHGIEILWPGPAVIVKYGSAPPPPTGTAPAITQHPADQTIGEGQKATFNVAANGTSPLSYQWKKNGSNISGANQATYTTPTLTDNDDGNVYSCVVSNNYGSTTSNGATLTVSSGSSGGGSGGNSNIIEIEDSYTKVSDVGSNGSIQTKSFSVNSNGKGVSIPDDGDKIGVNFYIPEGGTYKLKVWLRSGNASYATSYFNSGYSYLFSIPGIGSVNFQGNASSVEGPSSDWGGSHWGFMEADVNFASGGNKTLMIEAEYVWQAVDFLEIVGGSTGDPAPGIAPTIAQQPSNKTITEGQTATFSVSANGSSPLTYQWRKNGNIISGANGASYTTPVVSSNDNGNLYTCVVSNIYGSVTSNAATLIVNDAPSGGGSTSTKIEIENNYNKISDVGSNGSIQTKNFSVNSNGKGVSIPDDGDKIGVSFNISEPGTYKLKVWLRSGNATYATSYFNTGYTYLFTISGMGSVTFTGNSSSVEGPFNDWGGSHWGFMEADVTFNSTGTKTLTIESEYVWQAVDYLEIIGGSGGSSGDPGSDPDPVPSDALVLDMPFSGNTQDNSGNNNNGSINGGVQLTTDRNDNGNSAYSFDGNGDFIQVPHSSELNVNRVTISAWIYLDSYKDDQRIVTKETGSTKPWSSYTLLMSGSGEKYLQFRIGINGERRTVTSNAQIPLNQWVHVAGTFDGSSLKAYINGQLNSTANYSGNIQNTSNPIYIGDSQFWSRGLDGKIDEVKIYNKALTSGEIANLFVSNTATRYLSETNAQNRLSFDEKSTNNTIIYPNPIGDNKKIWLQVNGSDNSNLKLRLVNLYGAILYEKDITLDGNSNRYEIDLNGVLDKNGIYFMHLSNGRSFKLINN